MATLSYPSDTEVQLHLGPDDQAILDVVRRWSEWTKVEVDRSVKGEVCGVRLTTIRGAESTLRHILDLSGGILFPPNGGVGVVRERGNHLGRKRLR